MNRLLPNITALLSDALGSVTYFMPEVYLTVLFILVLVTDLLFGKNSAKLCRTVAVVGLIFVLVKDFEQFTAIVNGSRLLFNNMLLLHRPAVVFKLITDLLALIILLYIPWDHRLAAHKKGLSDMYTIVIGSVLGLHLMAMAYNLLAVYLSIEFVSLASYLLVAYRTQNAFSAEAALKYVLFGAATSAVMLYGISLIYGFTGTLDLFGSHMGESLAHANPLAVSFAQVLVLIGIGLKLSYVPVHFWVPDVYEGAATPVTAFLSTLPKVAGFALLVNFVQPFVFYTGWQGFDFRLVLSAIGIVTMVAGNFAAVIQTNVKRILAYSGIGHTGFALMAFVTFTQQGLSALSYYLLMYGLANIAALALANYFENAEGITDVKQYKGLGFKYPLASVSFVVILISLTGIPISAGFTAKLFVFSATYGVYQQTHDIWLLALMITGAVTTVVGLFYYIKIPLNLFLRRSELLLSENRWSYNLVILSTIVAVVLIVFGIFPNALIKFM
ncbi:NADH-quinone oxidoreductase subunit N [Mucilaginibacter pallidiroseus]|uniref:NADH-quinone oxidoreductase subunit N n=1 Tax=Mucilaginibacter pallidiroseus TaxID=2599295 RepID=A0A563U343_9SPHI|nr:NADH-quinone oxidoreductase subunit N [Mucilaginibacter pallidiroseus]TWR25771.1 NADH-quinone oxidoreductase subunit N [Mucilaginibacter pallidiroseus]